MLKIFSQALVYSLFSLSLIYAEPESPKTVHGLAIMGDLKYKADFKNFEYVNPDAPKGGTLRLEAFGVFDSLNPFVIKGQPASGIVLYVYAGLLHPAGDEPSSSYGYVAESVEMDPDHNWVIFNLRKEATFHDGSSIKADDVIYSFNILRKEGVPLYQNYYKDVQKVEKLDDYRVKFTFATATNRELAAILGQFPIFSKTYMEKKNFNKTGLDMPLGSGPYKVKSYKIGRSITYERVKGWWGENLPINKGRYNFDELIYDYYRDTEVAFEAFKSHAFDVRLENSVKNWATSYDFPAFKKGEVVKETLLDQNPEPMQGLFYNTRRPVFQDIKVREALGYAFDFEWANAHLFYNLYERAYSFFNKSDLACSGIPEGEELALLMPFKDQLPADLFTQPFKAPTTTAPSGVRKNLEKAKDLLKAAGWKIQDNRLIHATTGKPFTFEILLIQPTMERVLQGFVNNLKRIGIEARLRVVDSAQYMQRLDTHDYDAVMMTISQSLTPGNEQREFWSSASADVSGGYNFAGIKNSVIDQLIEKLINSSDRTQMLARTHALDRVLLWHHYVLPGWYRVGTNVAYWKPLQRPKSEVLSGLDLMTWWWDKPEKS